MTVSFFADLEPGISDDRLTKSLHSGETLSSIPSTSSQPRLATHYGDANELDDAAIPVRTSAGDHGKDASPSLREEPSDGCPIQPQYHEPLVTRSLRDRVRTCDGSAMLTSASGALSNRPEVLDDPEDYPKPPAETIVRARTIAWGYFAELTPTRNVVPSVEGGVDFVWYKGDWHLKIKVGVEGASVWAHNLSTGDLWAGPLDENSDKLRRLLVELAGVR